MTRNELIEYRISRAWEAYDEAELLSKEMHWNTVANRLYYACFYMVNALLNLKGYKFTSHNGAKTLFHQNFVKEGIIDQNMGRLYNRLFNLRQEGDYLDFKRFEENEVAPYMQEVSNFLTTLESVIRKEIQ